MNRTGFALVAALAVGVAAFAQGIAIEEAPAFKFENASASGSVAQTVTAGTYIFVVSADEGVFCCELKTGTATCASGGNYWPANTTLLRRIRQNRSISCRSASSSASGDVYFTVAGL